MSARSSGSYGAQQTCETIDMTGTSMASPAVAGTGLLIREYFMDEDGRFWTQVCNSQYSFCKGKGSGEYNK